MKTVLIGGASKGLGFGCSLEFAKAGYSVIMCSRSKHSLEEAAQKIRNQTGGNVVPVACDWSSSKDLEYLHNEIRKRNICIDILINNVGGPTPGNVIELGDRDWMQSLDLLFWSTHRVIKMVLEGMIQKNWGRIITISSPAAIEPVRGLAASSVIRASLAAYMKLLSNELVEKNITVNTLLPSGFFTDRTKQLMEIEAKERSMSLEDLKRETELSLPSGRFLDPRELGVVALFLASEAASAITGAMIPVDSGSLKSI